MQTSDLDEKGWLHVPFNPKILRWAQAADSVALQVLADPAMRELWLQCQGTWFVGVDALPTLPDGSIGGVPLRGAFSGLLEPMGALHRAQLSVTFPGYPRPRAGESDAGFRYRLHRDAAHVDGLIAEGQDRRRKVLEPHAFILGLPLNEAPPDASPLVVWEGSHRLMGGALSEALRGQDAEQMSQVDVTEIYATTRRIAFDTCRRLPLSVRPGEALLLHRHLLHGIAPWQAEKGQLPEGRRMAYFRPLCPGGTEEWLT